MGPHALPPSRWGLAGQVTFPDAGPEFSRLALCVHETGEKQTSSTGFCPLGSPRAPGLFPRQQGEQNAWVVPSVSPPSLQVAMNILNSGRFSMGSAVAGMLKKLIGR